jgi:sec-independent protein translocase protein TatA
MGTGFLSPVHIALVLVVVLMLFGAKRLPEVGRSLGTGLRGFKDSLEGRDADRPRLPGVESTPEPPRDTGAAA